MGYPVIDALLAKDLQARRTDEPPKSHPSIAASLIERGFHVFTDALPAADWFTILYSRYDDLANLIQREPELLKIWEQAIEQWRDEGDNRGFYCSIPPVFKDRSGRKGKRNKSYLQYCLDFANSAAFRNSPLALRKEISAIFELLGELHFRCVALFQQALRSICENEAELARFAASDRLSPIIFKLLRYNPDPKRFGSGPHFDKSGLSLLLHADDPVVSYRVGPYRDDVFKYTELVKPMDYPNHSTEPNHAVLVSGSCLREVGFSNFGPSPHSVLPIGGTTPRHSIVAFMVVPFLKTDKLTTNPAFTNDYDPDVT